MQKRATTRRYRSEHAGGRPEPLKGAGPVTGRKFFRFFALAALSLAAGAVPASAAVTSETLNLDSHEAANDGFAGPVGTADVLAGGVFYVAVVDGTYSKHSPDRWTSPSNDVCGTSESGPLYPSPGVVNGQVGLDPDVYFARFEPAGTCPSHPFPRHAGFFQINQGSGYGHIEPIGGGFSTPQASHKYTYVLRGQGTPVSYRIQDFPTSDNYGVLHILTRLANAGDCANGQFTAFGFATQTDCENFFNGPGNPQLVAAAPQGTLGAVILPSTKNCLDTRKFKFKLHHGPRAHVVDVVVTINGKR